MFGADANPEVVGSASTTILLAYAKERVCQNMDNELQLKRIAAGQSVANDADGERLPSRRQTCLRAFPLDQMGAVGLRPF